MNRREMLLATSHALTGLGVFGIAGVASSAQERAAPAFAVDDTTGKQRTLEEFKGRIVVLEWTSPSCPFVRAQYASGKMQELQGWATAQGIGWLSVLSTNPARGDYLEPQKAVAFNQGRKARPTALLMDPSGQMGHTYGARNTPHMFVINGVGQIAYSGAIDTQPTVDASVVHKSKNLVRAALSALLAGNEVSVPVAKPYGCLVGYSV